MAAGIGSGLPIANPTASMIVDIGGGTTEVAIISLADIACCESIRVGGDAMDDAITTHLKKSYNLMIGEVRAEKVKIEIGSAVPLEKELTMEIAGRDTITGLPRKVIITSEEIREALSEPIGQIIDGVTRTLEKAKPELAADLIDNGLHICGGGSMLRGMDEILANATGLIVKRVEQPLHSVARGTSTYIENIDLWKDLTEQYDNGVE
jgi:rod shape-determining protein MreB